MRILHLGKFYPPHAGGIERFVAELAAAQQAAGHDVAVLAHACPGQRAAPSRMDAHGIRIDTVPCYGQLVFAPISPGWPAYFCRLMDTFRPDVLHLHMPNVSVFWLLVLLRAGRIPWVLHWHADVPADSTHWGLRLGYPVYRLFERRMLARSRAIVATSAAYAHASPALEAHADRLQVIPLGMADAPTAGTAPTWPAEGMRLLAVGRLSYYKGFDVLLRALAECPGISLVLIGDGGCADALATQVRALGLESRVQLAGQRDDADLEAAYLACDALCLPSLDRAEAFGLVLLEAMRAAKPIVASDIPGSGVGTVAGPENALRVPPGDTAALASALRMLAETPQLRQRLGAAGRTRWEREYRIGAISAELDAVYRRVTAAAPTAG